MFSEKVLDEFYNAKNFGVIKGASAMGKMTCDIGSEIMKIYLLVENDKVVDSQFQCFGGVIAIAVCSMANSMLVGKSINELKKFDSNKLAEIAKEIPENKQYLINLAVSTVLSAVASYENHQLVED